MAALAGLDEAALLSGVLAGFRRREQADAQQ